MYSMFQVDAFASQVFKGNPAAVMPLQKFLEDDIMQGIAIENNLSETAFFTPCDEEGTYQLRWFTPGGEVDLCGHATLATAHVLFDILGVDEELLTFRTKSGALQVRRIGQGKYLMDLPSDRGVNIATPDGLSNAIGAEILECRKGRDDYLAIIEDVSYLRKMKVDLKYVRSLGKRGLVVSAKSDRVDFESRCFYPSFGIDEDPVTGSAHTLLSPYWSMKLQKNTLEAIQASKREGHLKCIYKGDRTALIGDAVLYLKGDVFL